jgi:hypothetical protein
LREYLVQALGCRLRRDTGATTTPPGNRGGASGGALLTRTWRRLNTATLLTTNNGGRGRIALRLPERSTTGFVSHWPVPELD